MKYFKQVMTILILLIFISGSAFSKEEVKLRIGLKNMIQTELKLNEQHAVKLMTQLKTALKEQKQTCINMDDISLKNVLRLCYRYRNRIKQNDVANILAAGSKYMYEMKKLGEEKKDCRREMCLNMIREMKQTKTQLKDTLCKRIMVKLQARVRTMIREKTGDITSDGQKNRNNYRNSYRGERGYSGDHGKNRSTGKK